MKRILYVSTLAALSAGVGLSYLAKPDMCFASTEYCAHQDIPPVSPSQIAPYSPEALASLIQSHHRVALFFQASWCSSCAQTEANIRQNIQQLPADVVIVSTNYDANGELAAKYGVTHQDMFVLLDETGTPQSVWASTGQPVNEILQRL